MLVTTKIMKNMKVRTKIRMLVGLAIAVIVLFTLQIVSISEKISTYVDLSAEELDKKANAIVTQGIITGIVFEVMIIGLGVYVARAIGIIVMIDVMISEIFPSLKSEKTVSP